MGIHPHLLHQMIGVLSQNNSLISQIQTLLPHMTMLDFQQNSIHDHINILLIDDEIADLDKAIKIAHAQNVATILLTDFSTNRISDAIEAGITDYIPKPISLKLLDHRINQIIERSQPIATSNSDSQSARTLLDHFPDAVVTTDTDFIITNWNKSAEQLYGWRADQVIGQRLYSLLPTVYVDSTRTSVADTLRSGATWRGELIQSNKAGREIHTLSSSSSIRDKNGNVQGYINITRDNTDRLALIEKSLVSTEMEYQSIIASMTDPVFVFDYEGTYLKAPKVDTPNYYIPHSEIIGKNVQDIFPPDIAQLFRDAIQRAIHTHSSQIIHYDLGIDNRRTYFSAVINPIRGRDEVVWVSRDITHIKLSELALSETEKRYQQLFENANDIILINDLETGQIIDANSQAQKQLGYSRAELLNLNITDIEQPMQEIQSRIIDRTLAISGQFIVEQTYNKKDGTTIPVEISARLIDYRDRKVLLSFARNIMQRKLAMAALLENQAFAESLGESISQLASTLTMSEVLDVMLETVSKVVDSKSINIMLVDKDMAKIQRIRGYDDPMYQVMEMHIPSTFTLRHMRETQQALIVSDIDNDPRWVRYENMWAKAYLGAPITSKGETLGYINLDSDKLDFFTNKHRQHLQAFADQAAIAIEKAQLYEASQRYTEDLEARVAERTAEFANANEALTLQISMREQIESQLAEERNLLRTIINSLPVTIYVKDRQGNFLLANRFPYLNVDEQPIIGKSDLDLINNDERAQELYDQEQELLQTGDTLTEEENVFSEIGKEYWILRTKIPFYDEQGNVMGLVGVNQDITKIKQAELLLRESHNRMEQRVIGRTEDLRRANADLQQEIIIRQQAEESERQQRILAEALQDSIRALNKTLNIDDVLDAVLAAMKQTVEHDAANIMLLEGETLTIVRQRGYPSQLPHTLPLDSIPDIPIVYESKKPIIINDTQSYTMWDGDKHVHGEVSWVRSNIKVPIIHDDKVIGILLLDSAEFNQFTMDHADLLQTFANQASIALQNARLYEQAQQEIEEHKLTQEQLENRSTELELLREASLQLNATFDLTAISKITVDYALKLVHAECAHLFLYDGEALTLGIALWDNEYRNHPYMPLRPNGLTYSVARSGEVTVVNSMEQDDKYDNKQIHGAIASIPLKIKGAVRGVMNISYFTPHQFTADELRAMGLLADQTAIAVQNSEHLRLLEVEIQERKRVESAEREQRIFAETLRDTAITLNQQLNTDDLFETIIRAVEQVIDVHDTASIIAISPDGLTGTVVKDRGFENFGGSLQGLVIDFRGSLVKQQLIEKLQAVFVSDTHDSDIWIPIEETKWIRSHVSLPIYIKGDTLALINLDSQYTNTFTQDHVDRLTVFSHQAAIALRNAQLVEQIRGYTVELESRVQERTLELENERILLQLERSQLRAILDAMRDGVYFTDSNHKITYINNALAEMTGYSVDDWLSGRIFEQLNPDNGSDRDKIWQDVERHLNVNHFWHSESLLTCADGTQFRASLTRTEVKDIDSNRVGIVTVVRNISLQKQLEEQKARFIANAAHELRTPIANIKTRLYLMKRKPENFSEHLTIAESAANWMQSLVDNLFDQSRFERGIIRLDLEAFILQDLMSVVVETQQPEANRKDIELIPEWDESPISLTGDQSRLRQVITNLINNAINYTPRSGRITVSFHQETLSNMSAVIISVSDTGLGIDAKHLPYLFQPFYQATDDSKGAGLGLSIAREIIEAHRGTIHVSSTIGEGTTFYINLPILPRSKFSEDS